MRNNTTVCMGASYADPNIDKARRILKNPNDNSELTFPWDTYTADNLHREPVSGKYNEYGRAGYLWKVGTQKDEFDTQKLGTDVAALHRYANQEGDQIHYLDQYTLAVNLKLGGYVLDIDRFFLVS
jgi:hypothetical protein